MKPHSCQHWLTGLVILPLALRAAPDSNPAKPEPSASTVSINVQAAGPGGAPPAADHPAEVGIGKHKAKLMPADMAKPRESAPLSPRFLQVRVRTDALLAARSGPPPAPDPRLNPFRGIGVANPTGEPVGSGTPLGPIAAGSGPASAGTPEAGAEADVEPMAGTNSLALLQQAVAHIKIKGTVRMGNRNRLSLNTGPGKDSIYGEGDVLNLAVGSETVLVRIRTITRNSVTLTYGDAEMELKF
jgi:hypothetical protein